MPICIQIITQEQMLKIYQLGMILQYERNTMQKTYFSSNVVNPFKIKFNILLLYITFSKAFPTKQSHHITQKKFVLWFTVWWSNPLSWLSYCTLGLLFSPRPFKVVKLSLSPHFTFTQRTFTPLEKDPLFYLLHGTGKGPLLGRC